MNSFKVKVWHMVYRPDFFANRSYSVKSGLKFYSLLLLFFIGLKVLLALPATVEFYQTILSDAWEKQQSIIANIFPDELKLSIHNGVVSTNVSEPYAIPVPEEWSDARYGLPKNLLVIDTTKPIDTGDFSEADTLIILGESSLGFHNQERGEFRIFSLRDASDDGSVVVDQQQYATFVAKISTALRSTLIIGSILLPFILYALLWPAYLVYLVFGAVIVWLGAKWRGHQITYREAYIAGLFLMPIPFLYEFLSSYGHRLAGNIPFAFTLILFVMTLTNFRKIISVPKDTSGEVTSRKEADK